ncbi:MAG: flagellum-specific ATP synthase FliI, partial [Pseudomonadota bacterium]
MAGVFDALISEILAVPVGTRLGRVGAIGRGTVTVTGLGDVAALGDRVVLGDAFGGEVVALQPEGITVLTDQSAEGLTLGALVRLQGQTGIAPDNSWIGRVVDPFGKPLDGKALFRGPVMRPLLASAPAAASRRSLGERLETGVAVFDTLLPVVRGQRIGLFAGSGVGKSTLLGKFARGISSDVVVIALIGERGRELREFVERVLGPDGMARAVVVTATSDQSALIRRRCAWAAMAVAEHFRDQGLHVLLLADSVTRFAEAHREVALAGGEEASLQ